MKTIQLLRQSFLLLSCVIGMLLFATACYTGAREPQRVQAASTACDAAKMREVRAPADDNAATVVIDCHLTLRSNGVITKRLICEGRTGFAGAASWPAKNRQRSA